jgi:predicted transposase/invertase (TIGR01784 family)
LYYWAKLYEGQLHEREAYHTLRPAIAINVLDFVEIANDRVHNIFTLRNQDGSVFSDHVALHFLELPKLTQSILHEQTALLRWLAFLKAQTASERAHLVEGDPIMEKAFNALEFLSQDEQTRQRYEARQKALHDYATAIETAERRGRQEGEHGKAVLVAMRLITQGLSIENTAQLTDLPISEVEAIAKSTS